MEVKLESLIEKLRQEGVEKARRDAEEILAKAKEAALNIVNTAKEQANEIIASAETRAGNIQKNAQLALQQAARDLTLVLQEKITALFERSLKREVAQSLDPSLIRDLIMKIASSWQDSAAVEVLVSEQDQVKLQDLVLTGVKEDLHRPIAIKVDPRISKGFRIGSENGNVYYDFTQESILEALKTFLSPGIGNML